MHELFELSKIFYIEFFDKLKEYQDELLNDTIKLLLSIPTAFFTQDKIFQKNLTLSLKKGLKIGLQNVYVAFASIKALNRFYDKLPKRSFQPFLNFIIPLLSDFIGTNDPPLVAKNNQGYRRNGPGTLEIENKFNLKIREASIVKAQVTQQVLEFLGKIGGLNHMIISSDFVDSNIDRNLVKEFYDNDDNDLGDSRKLNLISWDHDNKLIFSLPMFQKRIDLDLTKILPRIVELASTSTTRKIKIVSCELLHSIIIYMIGKSVSLLGGANRQSQNQISFANLYSRILPTIFAIACDVDDISTKIFNTLCLQIVRWFSGNKEYENKETACLLDTLMTCVSVRDNSNLRDFSSVCIGEFVKWFIKQSTQEQLKLNYGGIKSVIRRIQNNSNHPDLYNRYGALLALKHIIPYIREEDFLVEKYILEITQTALNILKLSHFSNITTEEMNENMNNTIRKLQDVIIKRWKLLEKEDDKRSGFSNIYAFCDWLFSQILSFERIYSDKVLTLWENFIGNMIVYSKGKVKSHREWIEKKLAIGGNKASNNIFNDLLDLEFDIIMKQPDNSIEKLDKLIKNTQLLHSQITIFNDFIKRGYFNVSEIMKYVDFKIFLRNVARYIIFYEKKVNSANEELQNE